MLRIMANLVIVVFMLLLLFPFDFAQGVAIVICHSEKCDVRSICSESHLFILNSYCLNNLTFPKLLPFGEDLGWAYYIAPKPPKGAFFILLMVSISALLLLVYIL